MGELLPNVQPHAQVSQSWCGWRRTMFTGLAFLSIGYSLLRFLSDARLEDLSRRSGCVLNLENAMEHHVLKMINECRLPVPSLRAREEDQDPAPDAGDASQWKI